FDRLRDPGRGIDQDDPRRDSQRHAGDHPLDRRAAGDAPAGRRLGHGAGGAPPVSRGSRRAAPAGLVGAGRGTGRLAGPGRGRLTGRDRRRTGGGVSIRGLVGLDIDGTILLPDETLSPGVLEAVAEVRDAGYEVMLATGRSWGGTRRYVETLGLAADFVVCSNGAVVLRRKGDDWERWMIEVFDPAP